jgi:hypothetical protein
VGTAEVGSTVTLTGVGVIGIATLSIVVHHSGGTASDGVDTSKVRTFSIIIGGIYTVYLSLMLR